MDASRFTAKDTGRLVRISEPHEDHAFVPADLPPSWEMPTSLWPLLLEAHKALSNLDGVGQTLPDPQLLLRPLQQREALRSSSLEGTFATPEELLLFELNPRSADKDTEEVNEWREVFNYGIALQKGDEYLRQHPPNIAMIRELHKWLMNGVRGSNKRPGEIRRIQVFIGSNARFVPPPPIELDSCLDALSEHLQTPMQQYDPLIGAYIIHYQFETIHPFHDGNGRIGRVLLALLTARWCSLSRPWLYMSPYFEKNREEYVSLLYEVSAKGAWTPWIEYCLRGTLEQARDAIRRCGKLRALHSNYVNRLEAKSNPRLRTITENLFSTPILTIPQVVKQCGVTYPTAKSDVETLLELDILREMNSQRPRTFYCPEVFAAAYDDVL